MVFSNSLTKAGIVEEIDFLVGSNSISYPIEEKTRNINRGLDRATFLIQQSDGKWDFEDTNNTDLPVGLTDIVAGRQDYAFDSAHLKVKSIFYVDENGLTTELIHRDDKERFLELKSGNDIGVPGSYCIIGNSIFLDVFPTIGTSDDADIQLKVYFARNINYFVTTDTTATPGFNPQFHRILSLYGAYDYALKNSMALRNSLRQEIELMEKALQEFYSGRVQTKNINMRVSALNIENYQ